MTALPAPLLHAFGFAGAVGGAGVMVAWRVRETQREVTLPRILIPPLGMSTGFCMFAYPPMRIPFSWAAAAFLVGFLVLSVPLTRTSTLVRQGDAVMMQRSRAFLWILLGLVAVRLALRGYVEHLVSPLQTGALFFVLAFGMILRWRTGMWWQYRRLMAG